MRLLHCWNREEFRHFLKDKYFKRKTAPPCFLRYDMHMIGLSLYEMGEEFRFSIICRIFWRICYLKFLSELLIAPAHPNLAFFENSFR